MATGFVTIPAASAYRPGDATVADALLAELPPGARISADGLVGVDLVIRDGRIEAVVAAGGAPDADRREAGVDLGGGQVWPCLVDVHTHLDKGHTWERAPNPDGTF